VTYDNGAVLAAWRAWCAHHGPSVRRLLITASRTWPQGGSGRSLIRLALTVPQLSATATLVHGAAQGGDQAAAALWRRAGRPCEDHPLPAGWYRYGRHIPLARDQAMVDAGADACLEFNHNYSGGAAATARMARSAGIPTFTFRQE
jgi:hypothetical protein